MTTLTPTQNPGADLVPGEIGDLDWSDGKREESLKSVYRHVVGDALNAIGWYVRKKNPKKRYAMSIRVLTVALVSAAGLFPLVVELVQKGAPAGIADRWWESPLVAALAVGLAAALFGLDRFFGYSSGWMRFITTELALRTALEEFEMQWQRQRAAQAGQEATPEQVQKLLASCSEFATQINTLVADETNSWVQEFQDSIRLVDDALKRAEASRARALEAARPAGAKPADTGRGPAPPRPGHIKLLVENKGEVETLDVLVNGKKQVFVGEDLTIVDLPEGEYVVEVFGQVEGAERRHALRTRMSSGDSYTWKFKL